MMTNTGGTGFGASLYGVYVDLLACPFRIPLRGVEFLGETDVCFVARKFSRVPIVTDLKYSAI